MDSGGLEAEWAFIGVPGTMASLKPDSDDHFYPPH